MRTMILLLLTMILCGVNGFAANGNISINGTINAGIGGVTFKDGTIQKTAAFQVLSEGTATPGTNNFTITIQPTSGKINLSYIIIPSADYESIMLGVNDNVTATGAYTLYSVGTFGAVAGKIHAGYGRTTSGSAGQYNSFDIIPTGSLVAVNGDHISETNNAPYWGPIFKGYLKYDSPQTITKINLKCNNAGATISRIDWKVVSLP